MSGAFLGILLALGSSLSYGSADFFGGLGARRFSPFQVLALSETVGMLSMAGLALAFGEGFPSWQALIWCTLGNIIGLIGLSMLYRGLAEGNSAIVSPVAGVIGAALPVMLALFWVGLPGTAPLVGFLIAAPGIWLVAANPHPAADDKNSGLRLALLSGIAFGIFYVAMAQVKTGGVFWALSFGRLVALGIMTVVLRLRREPFPRPQDCPPALVTGVLDAVGNATYMLANQNLRMDVAVVLTSLYPAVTVFLSGMFLKEKIRPVQWAGVALCVTAIILITQ